MVNGDYINGYIERKASGEYYGELCIEGIDLSPISAQYFKKDNVNYLWLHRRHILEYDEKKQIYNKREREPRFEAYLKKELNDGVVSYIGEFYFMRFKFKIVGVWDSIMWNDTKRLNLFIERLPMCEQTIINSINERRRNEKR